MNSDVALTFSFLFLFWGAYPLKHTRGGPPSTLRFPTYLFWQKSLISVPQWCIETTRFSTLTLLCQQPRLLAPVSNSLLQEAVFRENERTACSGVIRMEGYKVLLIYFPGCMPGHPLLRAQVPHSCLLPVLVNEQITYSSTSQVLTGIYVEEKGLWLVLWETQERTEHSGPGVLSRNRRQNDLNTTVEI